MKEHELLLRDYYAPLDDGFWCWQDDGDAVGWRDGKLIAFNEELRHVLGQLAPTGLPRFGALLLIIAATRESWAIDGSEAGLLTGMLSAVRAETKLEEERTVNPLQRRMKKDADSSTLEQKHGDVLRRVLEGLHKVRSFDSKLRTTLEAKAAIAAIVFDGAKLAVTAEDSPYVADAIRPGLLAIISSTSEDATKGYGPIMLLRDLADLAAGLQRVTPEAVRLRMQTGIDHLPVSAPMDDVEPKFLSAGELARGVMEDLLDSPDHSAIARLARQLLATTTLPRRLAESQEQEIGGYSDIANRGTPDRLLLSELAQDGLTLAVRVAMNEAMYLHRETPPSLPRLRRELLIDCGVRSWGVQRVFTASVALALAANTPRGATFGAWRGSGEAIMEVDLCSKQGLVDHLAVVEADPHLADAMPEFAQRIDSSQDPVEAIVLMPADAYEDREVRDSLRQLAAENVYVVTVDRQGECRITERGARGEKLVRRAKLTLDELIADGERLKVNRELERLPAIFRVEPFPLRMPTSVDLKSAWSIGNWGTLSISGDGRLLRWTSPTKGPEQLSDRLPNGKLWWADPECVQGVTRFVYGSTKKPMLYHLDIPNRNLRTVAMQCEVTTGVAFHNGVFLCMQSSSVTEVNPVTGEAGRKLSIPSNLRWVMGRYFVNRKTNAWYALSHDGQAPTLDPLPAFAISNDPVVFVWDAVGFAEPLALTTSGKLLSAEADRIKLPREVLSLNDCSVVDISHDGTRMVMQGAQQGCRRRFRWRLDAQNPAMPVYGGVVDERIDAIVRPSPIRNRFGAVACTEDGSLALVGRKNLATIEQQAGMPLLRQQSRSTPLRALQQLHELDHSEEILYRLSIATWPSGDRAILDSRGLLHLQTADANVPEIAIVLAEGELTGWCEDGRFFGKSYFLPEGEPLTHRAMPVRKIYEETVAKFVEAIRADD